MKTSKQCENDVGCFGTVKDGARWHFVSNVILQPETVRQNMADHTNSYQLWRATSATGALDLTSGHFLSPPMLPAKNGLATAYRQMKQFCVEYFASTNCNPIY